MQIDLQATPSRRTSVVWHTAGGWISNLLIVVQGLLLVPLYVSELGERLFGFWLASGGILAWFSMIDVGGAAVTKMRCAAAYGRKDIQETVDYFWHGAIVTSGVVLTFPALCLLLTPWVPGFINADVSVVPLIKNCLLLSGVGVTLGFVNAYLRDFISGCQRNGFPVIAQTIGDVAGLATTLLSLLHFRLGLYALPLGAIARLIVPLALNAFYVTRLLASAKCSVTWSRRIFRDYLITTPALMASKAAGAFTLNLPIVLVTRWLGPELSVAFSLGTRLLEMLKHFINHPLAALYAASAHYFNDTATTIERKRTLFREIARGFSVVTCSAAILYILLNQGFLKLWVPDVPYLGHAFTVAAAVAIFVTLLSSLLFTMVAAKGEITWAGYVASAEKLFAAGLFYVFIQEFGILGVPVATILSGAIFQQLYYRRLFRLDATVGHALGWMRWLWMPQAVVFALLVPLSIGFVSGSWAVFIGKAFMLALPVGILALVSIPTLRSMFTSITGGISRRLFQKRSLSAPHVP